MSLEAVVGANGGIILEDSVSIPKNNIPEPIDPLE